MKLKYLTLLAASAIFTPGKADADVNIRCDGCSDPRQTAVNMVSPNIGGSEIVNVFDLKSFTVSTYTLRTVPNRRRPGTTITNAFITSSSPEVQAYMNALVDYVDAIEKLEIPETVVANGWDLYNNAQVRADLLDWTAANTGSLLEAETYISALNVILGGIDFLTDPIDIVLTLADGSKITFTYKGLVYDSATGNLLVTYEIDFDSSTDAYGNPLEINETNTTSGGTSGGVQLPSSSSSLQSFLQAARDRGLIVDLNGSGSTTICRITAPGVMTCTAS